MSEWLILRILDCVDELNIKDRISMANLDRVHEAALECNEQDIVTMTQLCKDDEIDDAEYIDKMLDRIPEDFWCKK